MSKESSRRIVVCLDIESTSLKDAYRKVRRILGKAERENPGFSWESSDEWFDDGEPVIPDVIAEVRMEVLKDTE